MKKDRLLEVSVVAQKLGVSTRTVYRLLHDGAFDFEQVSPRCIRIKASSVARYRRLKTRLASFENGIIEELEQ